MPLDPAIKEVCSRIYSSDQQRFSRLIVWVKRAQSVRKFPDAVIAQTLTRAEPNLAQAVNWWSYLEKVAQRVYTEMKQAEAGQYKKQDLTAFGAVMDKIARESRNGSPSR